MHLQDCQHRNLPEAACLLSLPRFLPFTTNDDLPGSAPNQSAATNRHSAFRLEILKKHETSASMPKAVG